jgi:hypothetical protein
MQHLAKIEISQGIKKTGFYRGSNTSMGFSKIQIFLGSTFFLENISFGFKRKFRIRLNEGHFFFLFKILSGKKLGGNKKNRIK